MIVSGSQPVSVLIGASREARDLRRQLVQRGMAHLGTAGHLRGLRHTLTRWERGAVVLCVALDEQTLRMHDRTLRTMLDDLRAMPVPVCSLGLLPAAGLTGQLAEFGCDIYVTSTEDATIAVRTLSRDMVGRAWNRRSATMRDPVDALDRRLDTVMRRFGWDSLDLLQWRRRQLMRQPWHDRFGPSAADILDSWRAGERRPPRSFEDQPGGG